MRRRAFLLALATGAGCSGLDGKEVVGSPSTSPDQTPTSIPLIPERFDFPEYGVRFRARASWPMAGYDAGFTGHNPTSLPPQSRIGPAWLRTIDDGVSDARSPVTDDRRVYACHSPGSITAIDADPAALAWTTRLFDAGAEADRMHGIAVAGDLVVATTRGEAGPSRIGAVNRNDGGVAWRDRLPGLATGPPVVVDGSVYVATFAVNERGADTALAYSMAGSERWRRSLDERPYQGPCIGDGAIFIGSYDGHVVALETEDGHIRWTRRIVPAVEGMPEIQYSPSVGNGTLYVPGIDRTLYAVSTADGTGIWQTPVVTGDRGSGSSPTVVDEMVYMHSEDGLIALNARDGAREWQTVGRGNSSKPLAAGDVVVVRRRSGLVAYDTTGRRRWRFAPLRGGPTGIALAHNLVYLTMGDGRVYAVGQRD